MGLASVCPGLDPNTPPQIEGRPLKCVLVEGIDGCIKKPPGIEGKSYHHYTASFSTVVCVFAFPFGKHILFG